MMNHTLFLSFAHGLLLVLIAVVPSFAQEPRDEQQFFNGKDLTGWQGEMEFWSVEDGVIVGHSDQPIPNNKFLWSNVEVGDFYLSVDVLMPKDDRNAGIQFRSTKTDTPNMQAIGYQADAGRGVWGRLYHEHGRGKLDWTDRGETAVKPGEWNRYEILAVGHRVWTAINGQLGVAKHDPVGELRGHIAVQMNAGPPQTVEYRIGKLVHDPKVALAGLTEQQLIAATKGFPTATNLLNFDNEKSLGLATENVSLVESQVSGKSLSLPGGGASVDYELSEEWQIGDGPFSFSVWVKPSKLTKAGILCAGGYGYRHGWLLDCHPNGSVRLETANKSNKSNGTIQTPAGTLAVGKWSHIAVTVDENRNATMFVNAKEMASGKLGDVNLTNPLAHLVVGAIENERQSSFNGAIDQIGVWKDTLTNTEISELSGGKPIQKMTPEAVKRFADNSSEGIAGKPFGKDGFQLEGNDTVVFVGGANMVRSRLDGTFEGLLSLKYAKQQPRFRNMAWEGDTVYEQWRDIDFGSWTDQLSGVGATVLVVDFGQMEAIGEPIAIATGLEGSDAQFNGPAASAIGSRNLTSFIAAYEKMLDEFQQTTNRIVLLTPRPFEKPRSPHMIDHSGKNSDVKRYAEAIQELAVRRGLIYVDLFTPLIGSSERLTTNGIHLDAASHGKVARLIAESLMRSGIRQNSQIAKGILANPTTSLLTAIREKNRLWYDNWRPMNWSFAFGDRTNQQFGQSFQEHPPLKTELAAFKPLIRDADAQVHTTAQAIVNKQPPPELRRVAAKPTYPKQQVDPAEHTPEAELASFTPADGYEVNLFADESDGVVKPVQMRWDDSGRMWVACIPTYPHIEPGAKPGDYILVCEDTDGDGRADKFTRFAEGLFIAMGIEFGDGGVYVSENTDIVFLKDTDGDGKADSREIILSGFGTADSHQMVNNIHRGPCGDFWFTQGHHAYSRVETPYGITKLSKAGVWRYRPKTGQLDGFFDGSKAGLNCQGITHDDYFQTFHNSAAASGGFYTVAGAVSASPSDEIGPLVNPPERNTGIEFVGTEHLPNDMQGDIVWGGFMNNNLQRRSLTDDGSGFRGEKMPNLLQSSSRSFRPVNAKVGPDGGIYICDWYNSTIGHYQASYRDPQRDRTRGRIWRLTAKGRPLSRAPALKEMTPTELLIQLHSKERLTRLNAKKRLFDMPGETAIAATESWVARLEKNADYERMLMTAAGIYAAHEVINAELLQRLLVADDPRVRAFAARLIGRWNSRLENPLKLLRKCIQDEHPRVRLEAIVACSYLPSAKAMEVAAMAADQTRDHYLDYAMKLCVKKLKPYWAPALARGQFDFGTAPQRLRFVLEMDGTKDSAKFIRQLLADLAGRREPSGVAKPEGLRPAAREALDRLLVLLAGLGTPADLQFIMQNSRLSPAVLRELVTVAEVHKRRPLGDSVAAIRGLMSDKSIEKRRLALQLAGLWDLQVLSSDVSAILLQADTPPAVTEAALVTLGRLDAAAAQKAAIRFADSNQPTGIQIAAVESIVKSDLAMASRFTASLLSKSESDRLTSEMVALFLSRANGTESLNKAFADLAEKGQPLATDPALLIHRSLSAAGRTDSQLMTTLNHALGNQSTTLAEYSADYVKQLADEVRTGGDATNGRKVYQSKLANCAACHKLHGAGGAQGPDLSLIGAGRSEEQLAESVLWPNRQIREGFMAIKVLTVDGLILTGLPVKETDQELHLRDATTGKIRRIAVNDIEAEAKAGSIMPAGLTAGMTRTEVRDLIRFLSELRGVNQE